MEIDANALEIENKAMYRRMVNDPGRRTRFDPVNSGSRGAAFHRESRFQVRGDGLYNSMKRSSNLPSPTSPLQYFFKCLRRESSLPLRLPPHARHFARFPITPMCLLHSHFPRKGLSHVLQHHFLRMWLNMGVAARQFGFGVGHGSGDARPPGVGGVWEDDGERDGERDGENGGRTFLR